ncbi:hypothetical protein E4U21_005415 [Claviceps maximensis]|nr:hypothetical protein E4U21_005415 [Claviceps maximensis]
MDHAGMDHGSKGMGRGNGCKISMLFNLYTIDSCFLSSQWHVTSNAAFAGSCIAVFFLAIVLEMLRRSIKEYDRYLIRQHRSRHQASCISAAHAPPSSSGKQSAAASAAATKTAATSDGVPPFRPSAAQQAVRAFLHLMAFFVGYILMLLAMYYNGYILICIFLGAFVGAFLFQWETLLSGDKAPSVSGPDFVANTALFIVVSPPVPRRKPRFVAVEALRSRQPRVEAMGNKCAAGAKTALSWQES